MKVKIIDNYHIAFNDSMKPIFVSNQTVDNVKNNRPINIRFYSYNEERKKQVNKYTKAYLNSEETKRKVLGTIFKQINFCKENGNIVKEN